VSALPEVDRPRVAQVPRLAGLTVEVPSAVVEAIAFRVLELLEERGALGNDPWLNVDEAADYLRCSRQRVYDLVSHGKLRPGRDGRRLLFRRSELGAELAKSEQGGVKVASRPRSVGLNGDPAEEAISAC
jgi:excisionase family DNA binding protein